MASMFNVKLSRKKVELSLDKNREKYTATKNLRPYGTKRIREAHHPTLEEALYLWALNCVSQGISISEELLIQKAMKFGEAFGIGQFSYSAGWISRFKTRHNFSSYRIQGESGSIDKSSIEPLRKKLYEETAGYDLCDIYNLDETALFFQLQPNQTLSNQNVYGQKSSKKRLSVALCANFTGDDKLKPIVISNAERHHCFGKLYEPNYYVSYFHNAKAWMTSIIFKKWTEKLNEKMRKANRKILLLVDNGTSHVQQDFSHVKICFLPPNLTSVFQPMDAGIIRSFKSHYKKLVVQHYLTTIETQKRLVVPSVKEAIYMIKSAWNSVSTSTIRNCFEHVNIRQKEKINKNYEVLISEEENNIKNSVKFLCEKIDLSEFTYKPSKSKENGDVITFEEFMDYEIGVPSGETLSDEDIIELVSDKDSSCDEKNEIDQVVPLVSYKTLYESLNNITNYVEQKNCLNEEELNTLIQLSNRLRFSKIEDSQSTINKYFSN
ncbi:unnamed protein product [Brachionus calyciflorus]|uniref:HTH CENPB-type domain-containing protein n=1 Tax=Brachionus calyciflorus TaxID=104777 RepID=A0A814N2W2_9BILA|nr:unnamed protein product [Brachionus calyciflorus]